MPDNTLIPSIHQIVQATGSIRASIEFLQAHGIIRSEYTCAACDREMQLINDKSRGDGCIFRCTSCKRTKSIRQQTFLENSKLSLSHFIWIAYFWASKASMTQICHYLGLSEPTVIDWLNLIREVCSWKLLQLDQKIGGVGHVVQVDESIIYKAKYHIGHALYARQKWIIGFYDLETRIGFARFLEDRSGPTLLSLIQEHVRPGSTICTDC
jgi:transposase-like protein